MVSCRGLEAVAAEAGLNRMTLLRLMSSDSGVSVHAGTEALAMAYLTRARA
jgi:DNA-binding phage protein